MLDSIQSRHQNRSRINEPFRPKPKSHFRFWFALIMLVLLLAGIFVGSRLVLFAQKILEGKGGVFSFTQFFMAPDKKLTGEDQGEIRVLLMGIGGEGHEGPYLTDTMILATIKLPKSEGEGPRVGLVSIPRDLAVYIPGYDYRKINSAYAYGEADGKKQGAKLAIDTVERVIGTDVPYYGVVDFKGFEKVIDDLGGVEIDVPESFTDATYPNDKDGYLPPVTFEKGLQKMDGARALEYVRSRHGNNNQGSDFARSRRQQLVLKAVKDKGTGLRVLTNLGLIDRILGDLSDHLRTNLAPYELKRLYALLKNIPDQNISSLALDQESGLVCDQISLDTGAYLLVPCQGLGNYDGIRNLVKNQFLTANLANEKPIVEIQNASGIGSLTGRIQAFLNFPYLKITNGNFKGQTVYQESVIYDNTRGQKLESLNYLKDKLGIRVAQSPYPFPTAAPLPDFVIVITSGIENKLR